MHTPLIEIRGVTKTYPGVVALRDAHFALQPGEVRAILGKNGAGKSTLIKVLAGVTIPDTGSIRIGGTETRMSSPADGIRAGIATVHQELSVIPELSVAENIFLGQWPRARGGIDWTAMTREAGQALAHLGLKINPRRLAGTLSVAERQLVEIARALRQGARILILDEPTSSLVTREVEALIEVIRKLASGGTGIIYISHRMDEIRRVAGSVTVMRDGAVIATSPVKGLSNADIVAMMLGEQPESATDGRAHSPATERRPSLMTVDGLSVAPRVRDASFDIRAGEVLGIAGVLGSGRTEILQALAGLRPFEARAITLDGRDFRPAGLRDAMAQGVVMTPEDRRNLGAVVMLGVDENLVMASWPNVSRRGVIDRPAMRRRVADSINALGIKLARPSEALSNLSGGNQQKVVIGKALNAEPRILLLDEPTRGVDVGAKAQIYRLMRDLADRGMAVVFVSGEVEEIPEVCDRVVVLRGGTISAGLSGHDITTERLLDLTMGD
ncbi:sugar ABC transporter ATP-binding protein [Paracoccus sp. (in: a-proteobacteria)]|uniref:sugar ABC transporter ATP-binding protein n=1 Tax=Paracoccus sp. TaxID=267 RepID=UPI003A8538AE